VVCLRRPASRKAWAAQSGTLLVSTVSVISQTCFFRTTHSAKASPVLPRRRQHQQTYGCARSPNCRRMAQQGSRSDARRRPRRHSACRQSPHARIALGRALAAQGAPPNRPPGPNAPEAACATAAHAPSRKRGLPALGGGDVDISPTVASTYRLTMGFCPKALPRASSRVPRASRATLRLASLASRAPGPPFSR
jgi:hypothetical protein